MTALMQKLKAYLLQEISASVIHPLSDSPRYLPITLKYLRENLVLKIHSLSKQSNKEGIFFISYR